MSATADLLPRCAKCERPATKRGLCHGHYSSAMRQGVLRPDPLNLFTLIPEDDPSWREFAICRGLDPELFFPTVGDGPGRPSNDANKQVAEAKKVCASCPVAEPCGEAGAYEPFGVWGGMSVKERQRKRGRKR